MNPNPKIANAASSNTMGLFKLMDNGPMRPEYNWDDHQHELLQYPENEKRGADGLFSEAQAFFDSSFDDKFRTYTHMLTRMNREAEEAKESRKSRARKKW